MIDVDDLCWRFDHAADQSLFGIDLHVEPGETIVLCGASGSGKSTLLRACNGLIPQLNSGTMSGSVIVGGLAVGACPLDRIGRRTGTVLQHPRRQFFADRVRDELVFAAENFGVDPVLIEERVDDVASALGLARMLDARLATLSGGQQQRVAIAAALVHGPGVLLLDEPTSNLSAGAIDEVMTALAAVKARGTTMVIAEHRLHAVAPIADRVLVLAGGAVEHTWTRAELTALDDDVLAGLGLRPLNPASSPAIAPAVAAGRSVAAPSTAARTAGTGLAVRGLHWSAGRRQVLDVQHAIFPRGAVTAVVGENGAGKTSLTRVLSGLERHRGEVLLDGVALSRRRRRQRTAVVLQDVGRQLFFASVADELAAASPGIEPAEIDRVLADFGLSGTAERHPLALSGGQQQRLAVAASGLLDRDVMIFDEPSSGVDRRNLDALADTIRGAAARGRVVILVTHDDELLARTADFRLELTPLGQPGSREIHSS
ncbi:MAG: ABC transporter ATP-binding protein [Gordonia sp. (in: high G+C Gram-positive bacteria)]